MEQDCLGIRDLSYCIQALVHEITSLKDEVEESPDLQLYLFDLTSTLQKVGEIYEKKAKNTSNFPSYKELTKAVTEMFASKATLTDNSEKIDE